MYGYHISRQEPDLLKFSDFAEEMFTTIRRKSLDSLWQQIHSMLICNNWQIKK